MDKYNRSQHLEQEEETHERDAESIDRTEETQIEEELQEANVIRQEEEHLDINLVTAIEKDLGNCLRELKSHAGGITSKTSEEIGIIVAKIAGWKKNREQLREHLKHLLAEESTIQNEVHRKLGDENVILHEKEVEARMRRIMWGPEIDEYIKYEPDGITIKPMEDTHFRQIEALENEIKEAKENISECSLEDNISKLLTIELNKVYIFVLKEIDHFTHLENRLKRMMGDLEQNKTEFGDLETDVAKSIDVIERLMLEEIRILDQVPEQLIELKKEDLLDEEQIKRIEGFEQVSNLAN